MVRGWCKREQPIRFDRYENPICTCLTLVCLPVITQGNYRRRDRTLYDDVVRVLPQKKRTLGVNYISTPPKI